MPISARGGLWISPWFRAARGGCRELNSELLWKGSQPQAEPRLKDSFMRLRVEL